MAALGGALSELTKTYNWEQSGTMSPQTAAELFTRIVEDYYNSECVATEETVPTPYWDESTDLDDEEPTETQSWYGIFDGTFIETVENFVIAGFLAYAGSPSAAVAFLTIAPKFRLAWKTGNLGGIIRIFVDAADYGTVDTYSETDGVLERDFAGDPELSEHMVMQVLESVPV